LQALEETCSDLLPLYGKVCLFGDFNVDLLDPSHSLFPRFFDFLEMFILYNMAIFSKTRASAKLLDLFLVSMYKNIRSFRNIDRDGLLGAAASLDWSAVWFMAGVNEKVTRC
jgi:hypothetical protein